MIEGYPVCARIEVRWRDIDALGHVNNAVYFTFFEVARARYFERMFGARTVADVKFLVASIQCDYLSPTRYGETVLVGIRVPTVGRTSFEFEYEARVEADGREVARARSTQVWYDHRLGQKVPLDDAWLDRVAELEGRRPERLASSASLRRR
ncbi:MAG: acyl-CoA thioesterase [Deferrisomatales bacterium]